MELSNYINYAMKSLLKNPILEVLQEIKITKVLKQSNFIKRNIGYPPFQIILYFLYMLVMQKRQSSFIRHSDSAFGKDAYYRFIKENRYNWRKLLLLNTTVLLQKIKPLNKNGEYHLLIIDDSKRKSTSKFTTKLHHRSNTYHRKSEIVKGENILDMEMLIMTALKISVINRMVSMVKYPTHTLIKL